MVIIGHIDSKGAMVKTGPLDLPGWQSNDDIVFTIEAIFQSSHFEVVKCDKGGPAGQFSKRMDLI